MINIPIVLHSFLLKYIYLVFCIEKQGKNADKASVVCNAKHSAPESGSNYVFNHHIHVCLDAGIELRGGSHAAWQRRHV